MAPQRITCPDCKSVLKPAKPVPDGKKVKCPKCGTTFTTPGLLADQDEQPRKQTPSKPKAKAAIKKPSNAPAPPIPRADDDDGSGGGIYGYISDEAKPGEEKPEIEYAPDMSIKDLRGPAQAVVVQPSNYIVLICGISCLCDIFIICMSFWPMVFSASPIDWETEAEKYYKGKGDKEGIASVKNFKQRSDLEEKTDLEEYVEEKESESRKWRFLFIGIFILVLIYNAITIIGGVKMQNLESRRWGIASSIMTLLPMACGGISAVIYVSLMFLEKITGFLGELADYYAIGAGVVPYLAAIFVAVWSLRTLMSQEVIDGFEYVAD